MRPRRLLLENVHSFVGRHELDLTQIACGVLSGGNGNGKTTIAVNAPMYALFGETRGDANSIVSEGEQVGRVEFEFSLGEEIYLISRQRSRKGAGGTTLSFQRLTASGPEVLDGKTIAETDARIKNVLHMDADLLRMTAFSMQGQADLFSRAKPSERKQVLGDILDLGMWERRAEKARRMVSDLDATRSAKTQTAEQAEAKASGRALIEEQIAELADQAEKLGQLQGHAAEQTERFAGERAELLTARATDEVNRKALVETQGRQNEATEAVQAARKRLEALTAATAGKQAVCAAVAAAERAQTEAAELEAKRQERDRIASDGKELDAQIKAAKAEHVGFIQVVQARRDLAKSTHAAARKAVET